MELKERTVILVGLYNDVLAVIVDNEVAVVVFGYATEERRAAYISLVEEMCNHGTGGCLSMRAGDSDTFFSSSQLAKHLGAFLYGIVFIPHIL